MPEVLALNVGLGYGFNLGEDNWKNSNDRSRIVSDMMAQAFVRDDALLAEPVSPAVGDSYILPSGTKTGTNWGSDTGAVTDAVAIYTNIPGQIDSSPWYYVTPKEGWMLFERTSNHYQIFNGTAWNSPLAVPGMIVTADIVTATPPTTETPTAIYEIWDADRTDLLAQFGFLGDNTLQVRNKMHGGNVNLVGETAAGLVRTMMSAQPGGAISASFDGAIKLTTIADGIDVQGSVAAATPPTTELMLARVRFFDLDGSDPIGDVGFVGNNTMQLRNLMHGGSVTITGEDIGGVNRAIFSGDPDGNSNMYHAGVRRFATAGTAGVVNVLGDIVTATPPTTEAMRAQVRFMDLDESDVLGEVGYNGSSSLQLVNRMHGGAVNIQGEDNAGVIRNLFTGDPDSQSNIYAAGVLRLTLTGAGIVELRSDGDTDTEVRRLKFIHQAGAQRATIGHEATNIFWVRNTINSGPLILAGNDTGGVLREFFRANADSTTIVRADTDLHLQVAAGETCLLGVANSSTHIYANDILRGTFGTTGNIAVRSDGNTDTEERVFEFLHQDATSRAIIGHQGGGDFNIRNNIHGGDVRVTAEDTGGTPRTILIGDPDATTTLRGDTDVVFETLAGTEAMRLTGEFQVPAGDVGLTADVGSIQGGGVIVASYNVYSTVGTAGDAATLPASFFVNTVVYVKNDGANSMDVFPASGDTITPNAVDVAEAVAAGVGAMFMATADSATWTRMPIN